MQKQIKGTTIKKEKTCPVFPNPHQKNQYFKILKEEILRIDANQPQHLSWSDYARKWNVSRTTIGTWVKIIKLQVKSQVKSQVKTQVKSHLGGRSNE